MPHLKHLKNNRHNVNRDDTNDNIDLQQLPVTNNGLRNSPENLEGMQKCCMPGGCPVKEELIDLENVEDAVRLVCNNEMCTEGNWMHKSCFDTWEESVLAFLRSCGRARSWSEKQRLQNLWTKKGYDLAFKACDCNCGKGHLRKDLDYVKPVTAVDNSNAVNANSGKKKNKKKTVTKPELNIGNTVVRERRSSGNNNTNLNANVGNANPSAAIKAPIVGSKVDNGGNQNNGISNIHIRKSTPSITIMNNCNDGRLRANSISSTGSSPPNSASSVTSGSDSPVPPSPHSAPVQRVTAQIKLFEQQVSSPGSSPLNLVANGSIFRKRNDLSAFTILPRHKQNPYHIKMEDDALNGIDEVHSFVLNHLSAFKVTSLNCLLCKNELPIFDNYPLIDGTLFLSPQAYGNQTLQVISEGRLQYINAVCVTCLEGGNDVKCAACKRKWDGSSLLLGSMYSYDIFAAMPCCQKRLSCKHCRRAVVDVANGLPYFSEYSHMIPCPYCKAYDYHFIRPLCETFVVRMPIWPRRL